MTLNWLGGGSIYHALQVVLPIQIDRQRMLALVEHVWAAGGELKSSADTATAMRKYPQTLALAFGQAASYNPSSVPKEQEWPVYFATLARIATKRSVPTEKDYKSPFAQFCFGHKRVGIRMDATVRRFRTCNLGLGKRVLNLLKG